MTSIDNTTAMRRVLADEMRRAGLHYGARGVLVGGTSALEDAALEAMMQAGMHSQSKFRPTPLDLYVKRLEAKGLDGAASAARTLRSSPFVRAACAAIGLAMAGSLAPERPFATPVSMSARRRTNDRIVMVDMRTSIMDLEAQIERVVAYVGDRPYITFEPYSSKARTAASPSVDADCSCCVGRVRRT